MNKTITALILSVLIVASMISLVSATTLITGKIFNHDYTETVAGATVTVTCAHGDETSSTQTVTSLSDGAYGVEFLEESGQNTCDSEDSLTVSAYHEDYGYGSKTGIIHDNAVGDWDLAVVNVPLVPEFGVIVGGLTVVSAICVFFFIRRK